MTVGELIKHLEALPLDLPVVRGDIFNGYENIKPPRPARLDPPLAWREKPTKVVIME